MKKATQQQTKEHNRNLVLKTIFDHDSISRADIARSTHLTRTTVSDIVAELISEGLVDEIGVGESLGGKSPILLSLNADSRCLLGLDLAHNKFTGALVNLRGEIKEAVILPVNDRSSEEALALVYEILDRLMAVACQTVVGIGVGTPGLVNTQEGVVVNAVNLDWKNLPLASLLEERYQYPVYILNDSQAAAMGEYVFGNSQAADSNQIVINVRHGIGAGIIINGHLFQGDGGGAGEIGHISIISENGLLCRCGNHGCLETVASAQAIVNRARSLLDQSADSRLPKQPQEITLDTIDQAFIAGDPLIRKLVYEAGRYMGLAISDLVGILNIHKIVVSGDMTRFGDFWLNAIQERMSQTSMIGLAQNTCIEIGQLGENSVVLGACAHMINNFTLLFDR